MRNKLTVVLIFLMIISGKAQETPRDSVPQSSHNQKNFWKQSIVPLSLIGTGLIIHFSDGNIGREHLQDQIQKAFPDFHSDIDDYLQYVPIATMYAADLLGGESLNDPFTQTKYLVFAAALNSLVTFGIKHATQVERPNGVDNLSFPSGHTSNAFMMATVLFHEYKGSSKWLAYSGFVFASATGAIRVLNNSHWVSDVLVGAGIGILSTDLIYRIQPLKNWNPFKKDKTRAVISPSYDGQHLGVYANLQF